MSSNNRTGRDGDNPAGDYARYKNQTLDVREKAQEAISQARAVGVPADAKINPPETVRVAHVMTLHYADQLRPKENDLPEKEKYPHLGVEYEEPVHMWQVPVTSVEVPVSGTYDAGVADTFGDVEPTLETVRHTKQAVVPASLNKAWDDNEVDITWESQSYHGDVSKMHRSLSVFLPLRASRLLLNHLDACLDELGWTPDSHEGLESYGFKELGGDENR